MPPWDRREGADGTCEGCGSRLDLPDPEISQAVEEILDSTLREAKELRGACPLCGRSAAPVPVSHRKSVQLALLAGLLLVAGVLAVGYHLSHDTERGEALRQALNRVEADPDVGRLMGAPVTALGRITGAVRADETGWREVSLTVPVHGPRAEGVLKAVGGRQTGEWTFTTLEIVLPSLRQRLDLLAHRVAQLDPDAFVDAHTRLAVSPQYGDLDLPPARWDGGFPCVRARSEPGSGPRVGWCPPSLPRAAPLEERTDGFEVDLRFGKFILREDDLVLEEGRARVPLTRTYASQFWIHPSRVNAFGRNSTHDFDVAPVGTRNPYSYQLLVLPDGDFLYFGRISKGTGYADAVYRHGETSSRFYGAVIRWDGNGWDMRLSDGAARHFPESYNARNMAQGAATLITDANGHRLQLIRDSQRNLREVRTAGGHSMRLAHDAQGRVVRAEDDRGRSVVYRYGDHGLLASVKHSDGRARTYTYAGDLLTSVRDERGRLLIQNEYRDSMVVAQEYGDGERCVFRYEMAANRRYVRRATVELPGGGSSSMRAGDSVPHLLKDQPR